MIARLFLLLILFFTSTSFFWEDEEKQLRNLHQSAESALQKKEFEEAKKAYEELLSRINVGASKSSQKYPVDWTTYIDLSIRLATCYENLGDTKEAVSILETLLLKRPPEALGLKAKLMKARLSANPESICEAYEAFYTLSLQYPLEYWSNKDLSFFHAIEQSLNHRFDELMGKARRLLLADLYAEAIPLYEEIFAAIEKGLYPKAKDQDSLIVKIVKYRLAECHFLAADYEKSLAFCDQNLDDNESKIDREMLYLSALCYREKKEYEKALELLQNYTHLADRADLDHYDQALFEIGYQYYQNGQIAKACRYFERLQQFNCRSSHRAALYLARIYLDEGKPKEVEALLSEVIHALSSKDAMRYECYYLRGLAAFSTGEFGLSKQFFENSLKQNATWTRSALYHLGWCNLQLGDDPLKAKQVRLRFYNAAEEYFNKVQEDEAAALSLAQLYVIVYHQFTAQESLNKLESLLKLKMPTFSLEGQVQALLLQAECCSSYEQKELLYAQATSDEYAHTKAYFQAWYCRGVHHFLKALNDPSEDTHYFVLATNAFEKAFRGLEKEDPESASNVLKLEAKANFYCNSAITTLGLIEKLLTQFKESVEEREETLYLRGLLASRQKDASFFPIAEESFTLIVNGYPHGIYRKEALYALAALYYKTENYEKAKNSFVKLALEYPESESAAASLFWAAEAAALNKEDPHPLRYRVYTEYPTNMWAAEAYFREYPFTSYLEGSLEALSHLKGFKTQFFGSPLQILANYLLALHEKEIEKAKGLLNAALSFFDDYQQKNSLMEELYVFYRYRAQLELASLYLKSNGPQDLQMCEELLTAQIQDFSQKNHPLTSLLKQKTAYPSPYEEAEFKLAECYLKQGRDFQTQAVLNQMLEHYTSAGIQNGHLLSQVWQLQGKLAMKCSDYDTALNCFELAHESAFESSSDEQKLNLWLLQSDAFRGKKEYDTAMRFLSRVINAQTASPLRLKAMYSRAEIYELEGRFELAVRQLEATAKKGGEWAHKAQEKLRVKYGLE